MPLPKLKNLALLVLLFANLTLLAILLPGKAAQRQQAANLRQSLSDLCAKQEIALDPAVVPDTVTLYTLELSDTTTANLQAASALLGETILIQDDSTRYLSTYESATGSCSIDRNGSFKAQLTGNSEVKDLSRDARQRLQSIGFQVSALAEPVRLRAGVFSVTAQQAVLGVPVFSEGLTLTYANNCLTALDGIFFNSNGTLNRVSDNPCISAADALVAFLSARFDLGWVGSSVVSMEQGYLRSETAAAAVVHLTPVWRLETDTGTFYVNGTTGDVSAAA